jgi:predicted metal-dependent HD superfamily phosphohydrolase
MVRAPLRGPCYLARAIMMDQRAAKAFILARLRHGLPESRTYHSFEHTLDVYASAITIGEEEGIVGDDMELLKTAALFHDSGYLLDASHHESGSCVLVREHLPRFGYDAGQVEMVCRMIMCTEVPQRPSDAMSAVLCDADLDYLGRPDFHRIGNLLFLELKSQGALSNEREWNELQAAFLTRHRYFTSYSTLQREPLKQQHLAEVRQWLLEHP